ncbi:MAG: ABC transporter substrate-binding protein [Actinomycetota bacterium]|jgi:branched-chain amino acid transport system substrate-binding protein|nr:ABC transporter substrate-binding protein [Actinomycetota bacterium]
MFRRTRTLISIACVIALTLTGCASSDSGSDANSSSSDEAYRIGAILSLSGTYAGLGTPERNAIELEMARINDEGGVHGRPVEVLFEDDGTDEAKAQAAVTLLIEKEDVLAIIGATETGQSMAVRSDIERAGIPQVSMAGGNVITDEFNEWVFQTPWPNRLVVPFTLAYLKDQGVTRIALISDSGGYGKDGRQVTLDFADEYGMEIVADETYNRGDADMTAQLTKIKGAEADVVFMWSAGSEAATILKNWIDLWGGGPLRFNGDSSSDQLVAGAPLIIGAPGNARLELAQGAGDAAEGFEFAAGRILMLEAYSDCVGSLGVAEDFTTRYTDAYGDASDIFAGHAYDAFNIIVEAMKRLPEEFSSADLRDEIEKTADFVGVGGTFTFTEQDHNGLSENDIVMYRIDGGVWTLVGGD